MITKLIIVFYIIAIGTSICSGQIFLNSEEVNEYSITDSTTYQFSRIEIIGNNKTKPDIILRELQFEENQIVSLTQTLAALKRVQSLALFNRVRFDIIGDSDGLAVGIPASGPVFKRK